MKKTMKPIQLKKILVKPKVKDTREGRYHFNHRKKINSSMDNQLLSSNDCHYMNMVRDLNLDDTLNQTLQRSMKIQKDKSATELNKDIISIRLGFRKPKPISSIANTSTVSANANVTAKTDIKKELMQIETKADIELKHQDDLKAMNAQLNEIKAKMKTISTTINDLVKKIEDNDINYLIAIHIRDALNKNYYSSSSSASSYIASSIGSSVAPKQCYPNITKEILYKINLTKPSDLKEEIDLEKIGLLSKVTQLKEELVAHKKTRRDLKERIAQLEQLLLDHYHNILYQGIDFRQDGLSDLIKIIWNLDQEVNREFFPSYLDSKSIEYLYTIASMTYGFTKYKSDLLLKRERQSSTVKSNNKDIFPTTSQTQTKPKQGKFSKSQSQKALLTYYSNPFNTKAMSCFNQLHSKMLKTKIKAGKGHQSEYPQIKDLVNEMSHENNRIDLYEKEIQRVKEKEMERITKEFLHNNYERRYSVCIETMISALFGRSSRDKMVLSYYNTKKGMEERIKECSFYYCLNVLKKKKQLEYSNSELSASVKNE